MLQESHTLVAVKKGNAKTKFFLDCSKLFTPVWQTEILPHLQQFFPPSSSKASFFFHIAKNEKSYNSSRQTGNMV